MKVRVDDRCAGFGLCYEKLPELFVEDDLGFAHAAADGQVPRAKEEAVLAAIDDCPARAIHEVLEEKASGHAG